MPANLTPEYYEAEKAYKEAKTPEEKLRCLEYMLSVIPKHKGTDKMQGDLKKKIARLTREAEKKSGSGSRKSSLFNIPKEGAGQVVLVGAPNSGKSTLLDTLTNATATVADYPYSTPLPQPGMIPFENVNIQLVDLPPIGREYTETWIPGVVRNADLALFVVNMTNDDVLDESEFVVERLEQGKVHLVDKIEKRYKPDGSAEVKTRMVINRMDDPDAPEVLELVEEIFKDRYQMWKVESPGKDSFQELPKKIFDALEVVRVYTKTPGKEPDKSDPVVLPIGSTVIDFAFEIHKDLARNLKYARIWGKDKYDGQKVPRDYELVDGDVVELHD